MNTLSKIHKINWQASLLVSLLFTMSAVQAETLAAPNSPPATTTDPNADTPITDTVAPTISKTNKPSVEQQARAWTAREGEYYKRNWGVEIVGVRQLSSGYMLEFRYRVINPEKAKVLIDKQQRPILHNAASNVTLSVPTLDKVGAVRQSVKQEIDRSYYIIFGNPGKIVKKGNRVSVTIGKFHAENLVVQ